MKFLICFLLALTCLTFNTGVFNSSTLRYTSCAFAQTNLSPLNMLIFDIRDVKKLIEEGDNKLAITILKSADKNVRKVKEFSAKTKKITSTRIKKGIALLKQNKNDEALALIQTAIDSLIEAGFAKPSDFESI
ncbi:MAG: hypothetical protein A3I68_04895 [Candidatus Melainabacteria bacterium RIFCSPLOWO2_02_FULL_35_15]|nr:MAG: hypothetical protein A3F80_07145 [Candidatus Melainabacteria bacterium RIFCSPLOWO2_12_FULL_35_11]OGI12793.1 MAG: hypothetical protein A3I68_04895 [Candidatus Melainabacteria bacterium RIFCSPLOWO2_02_FULL_35_15]